MKDELKLLQEIADLVTDLMFCGDDNERSLCEKNFCEEQLCRRLVKLGYVEIKGENYYATEKSTYLKQFWENEV